MTRLALRRLVRLIFAVPTLLLAVSCVPHAAQRVVQEIPPITNPRALLRGLALAVPDGVADHALAFDDATVAPRGAPPFAAVAKTAGDADRALECLTQAIYYEARSETPDGQRAVAQVVLNRVRDRAFPHSVCGVVFQGSTRRTGCQFSFTCDGSMAHRREDGAWAQAQSIAAAALGGAVYAPVGAATYYHADSVRPWWSSSLTRIGAIGAHIFYRWRGAMERALAFRQHYAGYEPVVAGTGGEPGGDAGVAVHYAGDDSVGSVTIHRGGSAAPATMAAAAGTSAAPVRAILVAGVRIHRDAGTAADGTDPAADGGDEPGAI